MRSRSHQRKSVFLSLTRSQRRRRIGVQPISSNVAPAPTFRNAPKRNDIAVVINSAAPLPLLREARLNDKKPTAQANRSSANLFERCRADLAAQREAGEISTTNQPQNAEFKQPDGIRVSLLKALQLGPAQRAPRQRSYPRALEQSRPSRSRVNPHDR